MYTMFKRRELVILDSCPDLIRALPQCVRDEDNLEDVLKVDGKADDCYDAASLGLFGELGTRAKPREEIDREMVESAAGAQERNLLQFKLTMQREAERRAAEERPPAHWG